MNNLVIEVDGMSRPGNSESGQAKCIINNVPLQSWFNVIVTLNSKNMDVYYNGKLIKSCMLFSSETTRPVEYNSKNPLVICKAPGPNMVGGFGGEIGNVEFYAYAVNPSEAYAIYKGGLQGINTSIKFNYKLSANLLKNGKKLASTQFSL